jgi:hypothetical protein
VTAVPLESREKVCVSLLSILPVFLSSLLPSSITLLLVSSAVLCTTSEPLLLAKPRSQWELGLTPNASIGDHTPHPFNTPHMPQQAAHFFSSTPPLVTHGVEGETLLKSQW